VTTYDRPKVISHLWESSSPLSLVSLCQCIDGLYPTSCITPASFKGCLIFTMEAVINFLTANVLGYNNHSAQDASPVTCAAFSITDASTSITEAIS